MMSNIQRVISWVFWSATLVNTLGVFTLSLGLTNDTLFEIDPVRFSRFGIVMIMMWGVVYFSTARAAAHYPMISLALALEKFIYVCSWVVWMNTKEISLSAIFERDLFAGVFYSIYGGVDLIYMGLFLWSAYLVHRSRVET